MLTQSQLLDFVGVVCQFKEEDMNPLALECLGQATDVGDIDVANGINPVEDHLFQSILICGVLVQLGHEESARKVFAEAFEAEAATNIFVNLLADLR